ncbi:MAG: helix-turn-helix transcriptional regulator [Syntrophomonadaceae bacterium]|nr:helix-turn-helix transcriptional regulator [Syntrophomonadaceae bacterium]MDD3024421.1 helix-turn-helix transcriptional regulator [Syntrophomonadaceae bacterium]
MTVSIARNIRAERVRCGLTQRDMALKLGLSATGYNHKENGKRQFTLGEFVLICKILGTEPEYLIIKSH